jgi:hypothetical protein
MLQQYVPKYFICLVLCCSKCLHVVNYKCSIWMLHMSFTYVAIVCSRCFISLKRMLHMLHVFHVVRRDRGRTSSRVVSMA